VFQGGTNAIVNSFNIALTGNLQVVQDGPGTTLLEANTAYGPNTFTGGVVVNQGTLKSGGSRAIPAGNDITLNGGIFDLNGNSSTVELLILAGGILTNSSGSQVITPNNTVAVSGTIAASIAGTGGLTQQGNGTTTITVANGFTGGTFVNGGTLVAAASGALAGGPVTVSGGVLNLTNVNQSVSSFTLGSGTVSGTGTLSAGSFSVTNGLISASLGGAGTLTKAGTGSVTLSAFNSYTGGTVISAGELAVGNAGALGTGSVTLSSGTVLASIAGSAITLPNAITVSSGTGMIVNRGASALTLSGLLSKANTILVLAEGPFNLTGQITGGNAGTFNSDLVVSNATVTVSATNNNYVGPTYVIAGATLINGVANALPSNTVLNLGAASDTSDQTNTYNLAGYSQTIAALSSATNFSSVNRVTNTGGSATLTLGGSSKTTYAGTIGGNITLEGTGGGSIKLTRSNSYTGGTIIGSGKFAAMADGALGSGTVTLAGGTLELKTLLNIQALNWSAGEIQLPSLSTNTNSGSLNIARDLSLTNTGGLFDLTGGLLTEEVPIAMMSATNLTTNNFATTNFTVTGINGYSLSISNNTLWIKVGGGNLYVGTNSIPVTTNFTSSTSFFSNGYVGYTAASSNNQLHVSEAGTRLELAGYLDVGYNGSGNLMTISNGGVVSNTYGRIGAASSGNSVLVTGNNSHWINGTNITIGYYGSSNSLVISNQGKVTAVDGIIGRDHDATGNSVTVTGNNSHWTNSGSVHVGYRGSSNSLLISGGRVSDSNGYTGWDAAAFGNRAVVESNGVWINTADLSVGYRGSSNSLLIGSGTVSSSNGYVGQLSNAMGNSALVTGSNSLWTNAGNLFVGYEGSWNSLVISNGGRVFNAMGYIGSWSNAVGNLVTVTGSDSSWINSGDLYVGYAGQSNRLVISEGGFVSNVNGFDDGVDPTDAYNSVLVTGVGSRWVNSGNLTFGLAGHDNSLVISNRGTVSVGSNSIFGDRATASNNSVLVTGVGSLLTNSGNLYVGHEGSGNSLVISNEGRVAVVSNSYIGFTTNSSNNSVLVTGSNSLWSNGGTLTIGERGSGTLTIANSGSVAASSITIAASSNSLGTLNIGSYGGSDSAGTIGETTITFGSGSGSINFNQTNLFTLTSSLSGYGMVNQLGSGTTMLAGTNGAFTGNFNVVEGSLGFISSDSFGSGTLTLDNGGSMIYSGPNNAINNGSITVTNGTGVVLNTGGGTLTLAGRLTKANTTLVLAGGSFNVTGQITGGNAGTFNSDLVVSNATVTVSATNNNYVGPTYVIAGATLINGVANALPSNTVLNLGAASDTSAQTNTYNLAGFSQTIAALSSATNFSSTDRVTNTGGSATLTLGGSDRTTYAGTITGNIALNRSGAGTTTLTRSNNYSGGTLIESGRIITQNTHALGSGTVTLTGGALSLATNLTLSSLVWNSAAEISLPAVTSSNYLTVTGSAALTGSGTNRFNLSGVTLTTNPVQLFNFGTKSFTTNQFALTGVRYYELSIINNSLWAYNPALICPTGIPVMVSNSMTYQFVIFDPYSTLNITPTGNLTITSAMTVSNNSMVILNGVLTTPSLTVDQGSTLMGTGSLSLTGGNLTINGTFAPGNSPGTFFVSGGNLVMGASSVWDQQIYSASVYDRVVVTGNAILNGTMNITTDGVTQLQFGQKYNFLTASGGISGAFSSIVAPEGFRGRLLLSGDNTQANILIAPASYTQLAANRNQSNVATALNSFIPYTSGDQMVVSTSLDSLTASQYNQAFNAIMPNFYQQIATIAFNNANAQNMQLVQRLWGLRVAEGGGFSMSGLADNMPLLEGQGDGKGVQDSKKDILRPGLDNHWGMFVDGNGIFAQANSGNMLPGYNSQSGGVTTGLTYKWNENVGTGIYCGYQGTYTKSGADGSGLGTGSSLIDNAVRFGVFGTYGQKDGKGLFVNALAGGGYHNFQATRVIQYTGMNRTANSAPGAGELDTMLAAGYDIRKDKFTFGPTASLQYTYLGVNSLNETGAQSLSFNSGGWNSSSMLSSVGAHAAYSWVASKNILVVPQVNLSWQHEFMQNPYAISGNLGGTSPTFSNWSATPIRDFLYTGVGFTVEFSKRWNTSFFYNAAAGNQNLTSQNIFWSAGVKF
jgi:T5SS/PEP-CTERM-associated repeat protein/autotransporter-associated beta strand protein